MLETVLDIIEAQNPTAKAISSVESSSTSYGDLRSRINNTVSTLNAKGIVTNDRVAIVLPNGPVMATAFLAVASCATAAPLNPAYKTEEFEFYLSDLNAKALIIEKGNDGPAKDAAISQNIPIIELSFTNQQKAGEFSIVNAFGKEDLSPPTFSKPNDVVLVLHTSGTTSRPKLVPLTNRNICVSAYNIARVLKLSHKDKCLNVMPLFHIHGLIAAALSTFVSGSELFCSSGFNPLSFFTLLEEHKPTWYTAVPTMHQAIMARSKNNLKIIENCNLRFLRSSSSSLPPPVMKQLEDLFGCPVIEAYGMTEASHQMASNQLIDNGRRAGSVGIASGPDIAIMEENGHKLLDPDVVGEIVIKGKNVFSGYDKNQEANDKAFCNGWFRTGDQGLMDSEGYLTITGRLKEIINRGGEKFSPLEIDDVLIAHHAIQQVVTFAIPHDMLGEEVAAAVVLQEGKTATADEIKKFANSQLAKFKVPKKIIFLEQIPKGATGKVQRIGLSRQLGLS